MLLQKLDLEAVTSHFNEERFWGDFFPRIVIVFNDADRSTSKGNRERDLCLIEWLMTRCDVDQHQSCLKQDEDGKNRME